MGYGPVCCPKVDIAAALPRVQEKGNWGRPSFSTKGSFHVDPAQESLAWSPCSSAGQAELCWPLQGEVFTTLLAPL